jgi:alpha-1,2-mannosyltransferase
VLLFGLGVSLGRRRILIFCRVLLAIEFGAFLLLVAGTHGLIVPLSGPTSTDFVSFYAAGALAEAGTPQLAYDQSAHYAAEERTTAIGVEYRFFFYPPVFLLVCTALAHLPYLLAFVLFEGITLVLFLIVMREILAERLWSVVFPVLAFPSVFWTLGLGQNSFLTAALFGAATVWIDRRPILAGLCFGALCYKPHFGLLIPVALLAGCYWRACGAAIVSVTAFCGLSLMLFGWQTWDDFLSAAAGSHATYESGRITFGGFVSPFGAVQLLGGTRGAAYALQAGVTLGAGCLVGMAWYRRRYSLPIRAAILAAATLVAIPVVLIYDLMLAAVAVAWLFRDRGTLPVGETVTLAVLFVLSLDPRGIAEAWHIPIAPLVALGVVALAAAHALRAETRRVRYAIAQLARY